jgi:hypothetical protein
MYGLPLCNEYIKGLDAFIYFVKKDMLAGTFVAHANIAGMRRNIIQMIC